MPITRKANWLEIDGGKLFYWSHIPPSSLKKTAVIIIGPVGPEYMHCFRSIKLLADSIAKLGFYCVRYDPIGMGNSSGGLEDDNIWQSWLDSPKALSASLTKEFNFENYILIGIRTGCLVLSECIQDIPLLGSIFWYPYTRGAAYIRDIELLDSMLYGSKKSSQDSTLDGGGYPISDELKLNLTKVNLLTSEFGNIPNALVVNSKEVTSKSKLHDTLVAQGVNSRSEYLEGLDAMTKQIAKSVVPLSNIEAICHWISSLDSGDNSQPVESYSKPSEYSNNEFVESIIEINENRPIFGILTTPKDLKHNHLMLIVNTGAAHQVGPNRFHVDVARNLAKIGIFSFRFDLSNLGDSTNNFDQHSNHPYPITATEDINKVISELLNKFNFTGITLCGLCSGAHNIFHAAISSNCSRLDKIILINPLTFYWTPGQSIFSPDEHKASIDESYYQNQLYDVKKWLSLLTSPRKILNIINFIFNLITSKFKRLLKNLMITVHVFPNTQLEKDLLLLASKGITILLIHSENDPGKKILNSQASRTLKKLSIKNLYSSIMISDADHTFSSRSSRAALIKTLLENPL